MAEGGGGPDEVEDGRPRAVTAMQNAVIVWPKAATTPILTRLGARVH